MTHLFLARLDCMQSDHSDIRYNFDFLAFEFSAISLIYFMMADDEDQE